MYPLKFLFSLLIPGARHVTNNDSGVIITQNQVPQLMIIYGAGFVAVHFIFILLYLHALRSKEDLQLNDLEIFGSRIQLYAYSILSLIGLSSVIFAYIVEPSSAGYSGYCYFLIGPALTIFYSVRGKMQRERFETH